MKLRISTIILLILVCANINAQSISVYAINPGTGNLQNDELFLAYSIGDLVAGELVGSEVSLIHTPISKKKVITAYTQELPSGEIKVYPNPFQSTLVIETTSSEVKNILVYNLKGILVKEVRIDTGELNFSELSSGVYLIKIVDPTNRSLTTLKVIKH